MGRGNRKEIVKLKGKRPQQFYIDPREVLFGETKYSLSGPEPSSASLSRKFDIERLGFERCKELEALKKKRTPLNLEEPDYNTFGYVNNAYLDKFCESINRGEWSRKFGGIPKAFADQNFPDEINPALIRDILGKSVRGSFNQVLPIDSIEIEDFSSLFVEHLEKTKAFRYSLGLVEKEYIKEALRQSADLAHNPL